MSSIPTEDNINLLLGLGIPRDQAIKVLKKSNNDTTNAIELFFSEMPDVQLPPDVSQKKNNINALINQQKQSQSSKTQSVNRPILNNGKNSRFQGRVASLKSDRGFGFIYCELFDCDIYFNFKDIIEQEPQLNDLVEFQLREPNDKNKQSACRVMVLSKNNGITNNIKSSNSNFKPNPHNNFNNSNNNIISNDNCDIRTDADLCYTQGKRILVEESLDTEFKSMAGAQDPVASLKKYAPKYICAFLNSNGGSLFYGVRDDGVIQGLVFDRYQRDRLRCEIDWVLQHFTPTVPSELCTIQFLPVIRASFLQYDPNSNLFIVLFKIKKGTATYYSDINKEAWLKRDGSCLPMPTDLILAREREKAVPIDPNFIQKEVDAHIKKLLASGAIPSINPNTNSLNPFPAAISPPNSSNTFQIDPTTLNGFIGMGFQRAQVLEALVLLQEEGADSRNIYNLTLDRLMNPISEEEHTLKVNNFKSRYELEDHAMNLNNSSSIHSVPNNIPVPMIYTCRYCGLRFGAEFPMLTHENTCPALLNVALPCEICNAMIPTHELESHQINCLREQALKNAKKKSNSKSENCSHQSNRKVIISNDAPPGRNHFSILSPVNNASSPFEVVDMMDEDDDAEVMHQPGYVAEEINMASIEYRTFKDYGNVDRSSENKKKLIADELLPCEYCMKLFNISKIENHQQLCYKLSKNISYTKPK